MSQKDFKHNNYHQYLKDGGEMGHLTRSFDWSQTSLGNPEKWSKSLLTTIGILLKSKFPMFLWWGNDLIQFYNNAYRPSLGNEGKHPKALGQRGEECWPEIWKIIKPMIDQVMNGGESTWSEDQLIPIFRNNKLEDVYWTFSYSKVDDDNGEPGGVLVICSETTRQVTAREKTEQAEEMLRLSTEAANAGTWMIDTETMRLTVSNRMKELYGYYPEEQLTPDDVIQSITEEYRNKVVSLLKTALTKNDHFSVEYPLIEQRSKKLRWIRAFGKLYPNAHGQLTQFSGLAIDITEQKLDELRKNDFIGMVSHELKTPLTSLTGYIQLLLVKARKGEDNFTTSTLERAFTQVRKMNTMINSFLNISRLEAGKINLNKESFRLDHLISELAAETTATLSGHILTVTLCDEVTLYADRDKISSVISNLLSNAVKYSPKGKHIELKCQLNEHIVRVSVKDEGMGIKAKDTDKLFERFYRVESNHTQNISGFGIGLYLSAEIIERHHGKIWVESESGVGSTFFFELPTYFSVADR